MESSPSSRPPGDQAAKRLHSSPSRPENPTKLRRTTRNGRVLVHSLEWFDPDFAAELWMPSSFKMLLTYKMNRVGERVIICDEEYTSKTCSRCGKIKHNLGGSSTFKSAICGAVLDRDLNAANNIFQKNRHMLD